MGRYLRSMLLCFVIAALFPSRAVLAQEKELRLSLSECIDIGLKNNTLVVQDRYNVALAEAGVDNSRNAFLPSSSFSWSMSRSITGPREGSFIEEGTGQVITTLTESRVGGSQGLGFGSLSIPVYDAQLNANLSASKQALKSVKMGQTANRQQVVFNVKQDYFNLLQAIKLLEVQQEQIRVAKENLRRNETLYEIGSAPISNVYSAQANLASLQAGLIERENAVEIARTNLSFSLGLGTDVRIVPTEEEFEVKVPPLTYEEALDRALKGHPGLLSTKYTMLQSRESLKGLQRSRYHPRVGVSGGYGWSLGRGESFRGLEDLFLKNYSYSFSVNVSLPIFNMGTENNIKQQQLRYLRSQEQLDQTKRQQALRVKQAYLSLGRLRRLLEANKASVRAQEENFKLAEERYNFGAGTFLERLQAQRDLFQERNNLVQSIYNYQIEFARLEQAMGGRVVGPEGE